MLPTKILLGLIGVLCGLIAVGVLDKMSGGQSQERDATIKLCAGYFQYFDTTHKEIDALNKMCWR